MNVISLTVWTLENNCFAVYTGLIVCFTIFTIFHKRRLEESFRSATDRKEKIPRNWGDGTRRNFPDDEGDSTDALLPALPADTPHIPYCPPRRSDEEVLQRSREYYELMARRRTVRAFSPEPVPTQVLENIIRTAGRNFPDDEGDSTDALLPALPADTPHIPYCPPRRSDEEVLQRSREYYELMARRRTVRAFSPEPVPTQVLENIIRTAGTSPSGAHTEPWTFLVVQDQEMKEAIRTIVEEEEDLNYSKRMSRQWVTDLKPFATRPIKPYLSDAPALVLVFRQTYSWRSDGKKKMHYYSETSVAIAAGILLAAIQYCGLVALTSTPLNCNARLRDLLSRPSNERLELLLPVGRPHESATVPDIARKPLEEILIKI